MNRIANRSQKLLPGDIVMLKARVPDAHAQTLRNQVSYVLFDGDVYDVRTVSFKEDQFGTVIAVDLIEADVLIMTSTGIMIEVAQVFFSASEPSQLVVRLNE